MGILKIFSKTPEASTLARLPAGSFTVDREGRIMTSTLPQSFPAPHVKEVAQVVLDSFRLAQAVNLPLNELVIQYAALKITAKELRGGAIIYLVPHTIAAAKL